ncbi:MULTISPECIES: DAK2 domain-containing protein [unclassified Dehalobacter]|uniref:DAK2 domain-containing protein n=1 Tax=unclassified Dehalobacter TaxID=2635733 RepID=UPI000E6B9A6E|nr:MULTISPECIES: DAK2 domain-containing protein [unclassified Dehalobacter]TCX53265.1 dihydroxyacetone kinase [Dehalobacter sp. 14DCB1]TCX54279.1 dihydroxyacetone kinase [Dehalobacter sp. 12DCB1]
MKAVSEAIAQKIDGNVLKDMIRSGSRLLEQRKKEIDALNVFPVPDGDTGTNMNLTFKAASLAADKVTGNSVHEVASAASTGSLMGARGNSGVILSQIMRGIARGLEGINEANALQMAHALQTGVESAYKAVMKPVEGTILTVSRETARGAYLKAKSGTTDILEVLRAGCEKGEEALARTPEMLPVLKQAGVVDAGGQGFLTILYGWISALEGKEIGYTEVQQEEIQVSEVSGIIAVESLEFPYCTEFLVKGNGLDPDVLRQALLDKGDCLLVVGTEDVVKIHIHTRNPGLILDYAIQYGSLHEVQIHNMLAQNELAAHQTKNAPESSEAAYIGELADASLGVPSGQAAPVGTTGVREYGIVAVAMGEGIAQIFTSLGVDEVVFGGQTMNPSTSDLAEAIRKVPARHIFLLPNNSNIIMAAGQVNELIEDKEIYVIPTKTIPQAIASLLAFNSDSLPEENVQNMTTAFRQVSSGEVTYAVRNSQYGELEIAEGDILGLIEGTIKTTGRDIFDVAKNVLEEMNWREKDLVTIFYGKDMAEEDVSLLTDWLSEEKPEIEVEVYSGKQPLYYYILGVE